MERQMQTQMKSDMDEDVSVRVPFPCPKALQSTPPHPLTVLFATNKLTRIVRKVRINSLTERERPSIRIQGRVFRSLGGRIPFRTRKTGNELVYPAYAHRASDRTAGTVGSEELEVPGV